MMSTTLDQSRDTSAQSGTGIHMSSTTRCSSPDPGQPGLRPLGGAVARMASSRASLLAGLGKATKRGVRKCPKCATLNGTRGLSCKNRTCDFVFQHGGQSRPVARRPTSLDLCLLVADSSPLQRLFSMRTAKGRDNLEQRDFVLAILPGLVASETADPYCPLWPTQSACLVAGCSPSSQSGAGDPCQHLLAASEPGATPRVAQALSVKHSVLNDMTISTDLKQQIWLGARQNGPLVQRVSKTTMAVKCQPSPRHPLGYLHVVFPGRASYQCPCTVTEQCLHFYACLAVFASAEDLTREFEAEIQGALNPKGPTTLPTPAAPPQADPAQSGSELAWESSVDETSQSLAFRDWLSGVTQTMSDALVSAHPQFGEQSVQFEYHVPHGFCQALIARLSPSADKLLLPHSICDTPVQDETIRKQYVWHVPNMLQVKRAFDTTLATLDIATEYLIVHGVSKSVKGRNVRVNAYVNVGRSSHSSTDDQSTPPFILEWCPQFLASHLGRLRLSYSIIVDCISD